MSADVRKVLLRLRRKARKYERRAEADGDPGEAYAFGLMDDHVGYELQKLDKPKRHATKKAAPKR